MYQLLEKPELAGELHEYLTGQAEIGHHWVVYDTDHPITGWFGLHCFMDEKEATDFAREYQQIWNWHEAVAINDLLFQLKELELTLTEMDGCNDNLTLISNNMNLNNLEDRKADMTALGVSSKNIELMEENMKNGVPSFVLREIVPATRGQVEVSIPFKQSGQSEFYYFNKFTAAHNKAKPLEEGHKYFVVLPDLPKKEGKTQYKSFEHSGDAIALFNELKNGELKSGPSLAASGRLALMEEGKLNYVSKDFRATLFTKPVEQNFWMDKGKGFTVEQAANLLQGRSVYKDDLVNVSTGEIYKAWVQLDLEGGKESGNFKLKQFHDPQYGFDLGKVMDAYKVKEWNDPEKRPGLEEKIRNGHRPVVTAELKGEQVKVFIETAVRYSKMNFFNLDGKMEKREQFQKEPAVAPDLTAEQGKGKSKESAPAQGLGV